MDVVTRPPPGSRVRKPASNLGHGLTPWVEMGSSPVSPACELAEDSAWWGLGPGRAFSRQGWGQQVGPADWGGARFPGPLSPHADEAPGRGACRRGCVTVGRSLVPGAWFFSEAVGG